MKKLLLTILSTFAFTNIAHADLIQCDFTEPFITMKFDTTTGNMEIQNFDEVINYTNVDLTITGPTTMKLVWDNGHARINRIEMTIDYKGSNGMSDHLYPYSAKYYANQDTVMPLWGGCHSKELKVILPDGGAF